MSHDISAMIASRICHDLISPLGAISNGVELMQMASPRLAATSPELALLSEASRNASARLRFFRLAFGRASQTDLVRPEAMAQLCADWSAGGRICVIWELADSCSMAMAKRACLGALCLETALPRGGEILVRPREGALVLMARGSRPALQPEVWLPLTAAEYTAAEALEAGPSRVQFLLLREAAADAGGKARLTREEELLRLELP